MSRDRLLIRVEREWQDFLGAFAGLPEKALLEPGVVGPWSVRDILCHITTWEGEFLKVLPLILTGKPMPRYRGIDAFNAREQEKKRKLSLDQVRRELAATHERLVSALASLPATTNAIENRLRRRLRLDTHHHYREHAAQISAWRKARFS